ncbi:auxin efflux carrier [Melampsora americana]|nr:auxin efflux carrier [Melampsora americana]
MINQIVINTEAAGLDLFLIIRTVAGSILEVFFLCIVGYILARKKIITAQSKTTLNQINVAFFTPALMFSKVAFSLTIDKLAELYIVPIGFIVTTAVSALIAHLLAGSIFRLRSSESRYCIAVSMFMNSNSLPIALVTSLIGHLQGTNGLEWGPNDSKNKQLGRSITYLVVFSTLGLVLRWSYGVSLLSAPISTATTSNADIPANRRTPPAHDLESTPLLNADTNHQDVPKTPSPSSLRLNLDSEDQDQQPINRRSSLLRPAPITTARPNRSPSASSVSFVIPTMPRRTSSSTIITDISASSPRALRHDRAHDDEPPASPEVGRLRRPIFQSFPNIAVRWAESIASSSQSRRSSVVSASQDGEEESGIDGVDGVDAVEPLLGTQSHLQHKAHHGHHQSKSWIQKNFKRYCIRPLKRIQQFMTPPLYASLLSLVVVCIPPLQDWLETVDPLCSALKSAGHVSVPLTLVVLGAYFHDDRKPETLNNDNDQEEEDHPFESLKHRAIRARSDRLTVTAAVLSRQILTPLILIPILYFIIKLLLSAFPSTGDGSGGVHEDPCFILVSVLLIGAPPAITLAQMTCTNPFPIGTKAFKEQDTLNHRFQRLISKTLLVSYVFVTPVTTVILVVAGIVLVQAIR